MSDAEFRDWLREEVQGGRLTPQQRDDLLEQKEHFDHHRSEIERQYRHQVVGYVSGTQQVARSVHELLARANERFPARMVYFEPVAVSLF